MKYHGFDLLLEVAASEQVQDADAVADDVARHLRSNAVDNWVYSVREALRQSAQLSLHVTKPKIDENQLRRRAIEEQMAALQNELHQLAESPKTEDNPYTTGVVQGVE